MESSVSGQRSGWVTFAGVIAVVVGGYNALSGIAALADEDTLKAQATKVLFSIDLTVWGWFWLIVGAIQLFAGVLVLQRNEWGRWLAMGFAAISALFTIFVIFVFPLWSVAVLALDCIVLYALTTREADFNP